MNVSNGQPSIECTEIAGISTELQLVGSEVPQLPDSYHFSTKLLRCDKHVQELINEHYPPDEYGRKIDIPPADWISYSRKCVTRGRLLIDVGIEDDKNALIGFGRVNDALFSDFIVHTDHRRRGLGTAIILARFRLARKAGVRTLYTGALEQTNNRLSVYTRLGFRQADDGKLFYNADGRSIPSWYSEATEPI